MGDDIRLGLSSMAFCFDFCSTHVVQLSNRNFYFYRFQCYHPLITKLSYAWLWAESMRCLVAPRGSSGTTKVFLFESKPMFIYKNF